MAHRVKGIQALSTVLKNEKNVDIFEKSIHEKSNGNDDLYISYLYEVIGDILEGSKLKPILVNIQGNKFNWDHSCFQEVKNRQEEQDDFIEYPIRVVEGILECYKCGSKKIVSFNKTDRGLDEGTSIYCTCTECGIKWRQKG